MKDDPPDQLENDELTFTNNQSIRATPRSDNNAAAPQHWTALIDESGPFHALATGARCFAIALVPTRRVNLSTLDASFLAAVTPAGSGIDPEHLHMTATFSAAALAQARGTSASRDRRRMSAARAVRYGLARRASDWLALRGGRGAVVWSHGPARAVEYKRMASEALIAACLSVATTGDMVSLDVVFEGSRSVDVSEIESYANAIAPWALERLDVRLDTPTIEGKWPKGGSVPQLFLADALGHCYSGASDAVALTPSELRRRDDRYYGSLAAARGWVPRPVFFTPDTLEAIKRGLEGSPHLDEVLLERSSPAVAIDDAKALRRALNRGVVR